MKQKRKKSEIKAVVFDVGGVLQLNKFSESKNSNVYETKGTHETIIRKAKISIDYYMDAIDLAYPKSIEGKMSEKQVISILARNLGLPKNQLTKEYEKTYKKAFGLNQELFDFAIKLKEKGLKIAILSDMWHISKKALIIKKFYKNFNPVILSCDVGTRKPYMEIYELTCKKLNLSPEEILFIDNRKWNLIPAKKLGIKTILFENNNQTIKEMKKYLENIYKL